MRTQDGWPRKLVVDPHLNKHGEMDYDQNALKYTEVAEQLVVFGPGSIDQAHQAVEWVDIDQLNRAVDIYRTWFTQ